MLYRSVDPETAQGVRAYIAFVYYVLQCAAAARTATAQAFLADGMAPYVESILSRTELAKLDFIDVDFATRFVEKLVRTPSHQISPRENQAFMLLLSLALLRRDFVERARSRPTVPDALFVRRIDLRGRQAP